MAVKGLIGKCGCTRMVQRGYNVALGGATVDGQFTDNINGGKWLPHKDMAQRLCETAVEHIHELEIKVGCFLDRNVDSRLHQKAFVGQTADRTVHKGEQPSFMNCAMLDNHVAVKEDGLAIFGDASTPPWNVKMGDETMIEGGPIVLEAAFLAKRHG